MWKLLQKLQQDVRGVAMLEYLILALLITGVVAAIVAGVRSPLTDTHNSVIENIITITGSGY